MKGDLSKRIKEIFERSPYIREIVKMIHKLSMELRTRGYDNIRIMNFCGTHEWTITYYGIRSIIPENIDLVAGPGCPVCITPGTYVEDLIKLSFEGYCILTYGDAFKLPSTRGADVKSLSDAASLGGCVRIVYSFMDAIRIATTERDKDFVFFAIGFETTMPSTAEPLYKGVVPKNLLILPAYRFTPPIMKYLLDEVRDVVIHGVIAPGHVSAVIGASSWEFLAKDYGIPTVVAGFEPADVLIAIFIILKQILSGKACLVNEYRRVVRYEGNLYAKRIIAEVYERRDAYWRGIGVVPMSGGYLKDRYWYADAFRQLGLRERHADDLMPGCRCHEVVVGKAKPIECPLFMKVCTPDKPYGPCMVSVEGTCRIWALNMPVFKPGGDIDSLR